MKRLTAMLLTLFLCLSLAACSGGETAGQETDQEDPAPVTEPEAGAETPAGEEVTLYADFSAGSETAGADGLIRTETATAAEKTPEALAAALTEWTGLDFTLSGATVDGTTVTVDWAASSTLVAGLDDREQKEDFFFHDQDSLRWFMMDSLWQTLTANLSAEEVYYTMDGGQELTFDELAPVSTFPSGIAYLGSPFYFAHADGRGDDDAAGETGDAGDAGDPVDTGAQADFSRTEGNWYLDGEAGSASLYMDGEGGFIAFYASGYTETAGYLEYVDEYGDGNGRYDMYDGEGNFINGFYFDSDTQIHIGNGDLSSVYIRLDTPPVDGEEEMPAPGVLVYSPGFTGLTPLEADNDYFGGYYYADQTEDGLTTIVNCGFTNDSLLTDETTEEAIARWLEMVCGEMPGELSMEETVMESVPAYRLTWRTGANEDTRQWDGLMVLTDLYTYLYAFDTHADHAAEMVDTWEEVFASLELIFPEES